MPIASKRIPLNSLVQEIRNTETAIGKAELQSIEYLPGVLDPPRSTAMDKYAIQGHALIFGLFLGWAVVIGCLHWTGHGFAMDNDQDQVLLETKN